MNKWFDKPRPSLGTLLSATISVVVTDDRLTELLGAIHGKVSPKTYGVLLRLAKMPPAVRLTVNIKTVLDLLVGNNIEDILREGLTQDEFETLVEIDRLGVSPSAKETAHSLMDIDDRLAAVNALNATYRDRRTKRRHVIVPRLLDY